MGATRRKAAAHGLRLVGTALASAVLVAGPVAVEERAGAGEAPEGIDFQGAGGGASASVIVPAPDVDEVFVDVRGGRGGVGSGDGAPGIPGGLGGRVLGPITIEPGARIEVRSGLNGNGTTTGQGAQGVLGSGGGGAAVGVGGAGGGAGGGSADLRVGPANTELQLEHRVVVAGGGGGGGGHHQAAPPAGAAGGAGSGDVGTAGTCAGDLSGAGATTTSPGEAGGGAGGGSGGAPGSSVQGGAGGASSAVGGEGGGGGGAGYLGGGGAGAAVAGANPSFPTAGCGGGGSGLAPAGTLTQTGVSTGPRAYVWSCDEGCTPAFADVPRDHPFFWEIEIDRWQGWVDGFSDGGFRPSARVSRQAMAAFLFRAFEVEEFAAPSTPTFPDVPRTSPFYRQVEWLASTGITGGYADGTFRPAAPVTRQSMSAFLFRASEEAAPATTTATFPDVPVGTQFHPAVEWMAATAVTTGFSDGRFHPAAPVTRQAMAAFLLRFAPFTPYG